VSKNIDKALLLIPTTVMFCLLCLAFLVGAVAMVMEFGEAGVVVMTIFLFICLAIYVFLYRGEKRV
jgi:L-asparagine transporter-like permease